MKIKLGEKYGDSGPISAPDGPDKNKMMYPSVHLTGKDAKLADLPDSGTITFHFTKEEETKEKRDGKTTWRCRLELHEIRGVKADSEGASEFEDTETAMGRYKEEAESEEYEEEDED